MTQQIINVCKRAIKVSEIFQGQTEDSMKAMQQSIMVCSEYNKALEEVSPSLSNQLIKLNRF